MRAVHAESLGSRDFNNISDGQRQRVLLARAICQEPDIIILDEPTSFLDIKHKLDLLSILRDMAKKKQTPQRIAEATGVHVATIYREMKRGQTKDGYSAIKAQCEVLR